MRWAFLVEPRGYLSQPVARVFGGPRLGVLGEPRLTLAQRALAGLGERPGCCLAVWDSSFFRIWGGYLLGLGCGWIWFFFSSRRGLFLVWIGVRCTVFGGLLFGRRFSVRWLAWCGLGACFGLPFYSLRASLIVTTPKFRQLSW